MSKTTIFLEPIEQKLIELADLERGRAVGAANQAFADAAALVLSGKKIPREAEPTFTRRENGQIVIEYDPPTEAG